LRKNQTEAEAKLWRLLRAKRLAGHKFRRQLPIGRYIVDFACPAAHLIVELDGSQHADSAYDQRRDAWLATQGWRVLRLWNNDLADEDIALTAILASLSPPLPNPASGWKAPLCFPGHAGSMTDPDAPTRGEGLSGATHA